MAAQIFAPQFLILTMMKTMEPVIINTNEIRSIWPANDGKQSTIFYGNNSTTVTRPFNDLANDIAAKNCK